MSTKLLLTVTSLLLAGAGLAALFAPETLLASEAAPLDARLALLVQLLGALYFGFALVNWTARESALGGIYGRPIGLGNFAHFTIGALTLVKVVAADPTALPVVGALLVYAVLALIYGWLLFAGRGLPAKRA